MNASVLLLSYLEFRSLHRCINERIGPRRNGHRFADGILKRISWIKVYFDPNFTEFCSKVSNWYYGSIGSGMMTWRQTGDNPDNKYSRMDSWWRHPMETFSALLAICAGNSPVPGEFPAQRPVTRSFDVFFDLRLNKRLSIQSWGWWFETPLLAPIMTSS